MARIALLAGDGIGPEILPPALEVLNAVAPGQFEYEEHVFGGAVYRVVHAQPAGPGPVSVVR